MSIKKLKQLHGLKQSAFVDQEILCEHVGIDEETIQDYIRQQEGENKRLDQLDFFRCDDQHIKDGEK